jgi:glutamate N-acetyltransferase/amino-acid N-acetyltransferase
MARLAAEAVGRNSNPSDASQARERIGNPSYTVRAEQALVMSTGVIGTFLPMEKVAAGISAAAAKLGSDEASLLSAARGMMTTDTRHKLSGRTLTLRGRTTHICGLAKGAAMIGPNMATMLSAVLTDAALTPEAAQVLLREAVNDSFNCISVEGHMSTSDTVLLLANGAACADPLAGDDLAELAAAAREVCTDLAKQIVSDGEGAGHFITIDVTGCASRADAHRIAKTIGESALVKTAIAGADPNWGRIVSAAGYAGPRFDPRGVSLKLNGMQLYERGGPVPFDTKAASRSIRENRDTHIELSLSEGSGRVRFWTTDLTAEYVRLNADYTT